MNAVIAEYSNANKAQATEVTPHRLVQLLMQSAIDKLAAGKGCIERKDIEGAHQNITTVMTIILTLRESLDMEVGGEVSVNLDLLYGYMHTRLVDVLGKHDLPAADEVASLFKELLKGWTAMPDEIKQATDLTKFA